MKPAIKSLLLIMLLLACTPGMAGIYKWVDQHGNVHFGDRPPENTKAESVEIKINTFKGVSIGKLDTSVGNNVIIYTTPWCKYCQTAKKYFKKNKIAFTEYDIEKSKRARSKFKRLGGKGVPLILVGANKMSGFSRGKFQKLYDKQ